MRFTKHIHVLHLLSQIPEQEMEYYLRDACKYTEAGRVGPYVNRRRKEVMTSEEAVAAFDHLFHYIHTNWQQPVTANPVDTQLLTFPQMTAANKHEYIDCREMLRMKQEEFVAKLESLPPHFQEYLFPVAVARYMLRELAMPINHRKSTQFREFHRRYGNMILMLD
jgi:hypothetical protein